MREIERVLRGRVSRESIETDFEIERERDRERERVLREGERFERGTFRERLLRGSFESESV